jgi:mRNA interferase MazF
VWDIVGGRINPGSKLIDNLKREVKEETGLEIVSQPKLLNAQDIIVNNEKHVVRLTYMGESNGDVKLDLSENTDHQWLSMEEIKNKEDLDVYVKEIVNQLLSEQLKVSDFDIWNKEKQKLDSEEYSKENFPKEGEVWMCSVGVNIGFEQNGTGSNFSRPVVVIKKFNNKMFWAAALSTKQKNLDFYYNFTDPNGKTVSVILAQLKLVSLKRLKRMMYNLPSGDFKNIKQRLRGYV